MRVKQVNSFYFFEGNNYSENTSHVLTKYANENISLWCIIGSAQLPLDQDSFKRMKKNVNFLQKNNVFFIGLPRISKPEKPIEPEPPSNLSIPLSTRMMVLKSSLKDYDAHLQLYHKRLDRFNNNMSNEAWNVAAGGENREYVGSIPMRLNLKNLNDEMLAISCRKCDAPPFYPCITSRGDLCKTHVVRKSDSKEISFVGNRRTGPGNYYYHRKKIYLAETEKDVRQFIESNSIEPIGKNRARRTIPDEVQIFVWKRDGGICVKCGSDQNLAFDHIIPHSLGGSDTRRNLQILCDTCNSKKGNKVAG